jgi:hypothetical protein
MLGGGGGVAPILLYGIPSTPLFAWCGIITCIHLLFPFLSLSFFHIWPSVEGFLISPRRDSSFRYDLASAVLGLACPSRFCSTLSCSVSWY